MRNKIFALLAATTATTIYGVNHTIANLVMPHYIGSRGFVLLRVLGATLMFWFLSLFFKSKPIALSQIKCRTPPRKWYQIAQSEQSNTSSPNQLVNIASANIKYCSEVAAANNHQIIKKTQKIRAFPVIRINIELTDVSCGL